MSASVAGFKPFYKSAPGVQYFRRDNGDGTSTYVGQQDITDVLEANKAEFNEDVKGRLAARGQWGVKIATVPMIVLNKWMEDHLDPRDPDANEKLSEIMMRKLEDPDFRDFKTANIRL